MRNRRRKTMIGEELLGHDGRDFHSDKVGAGLDQIIQLLAVFPVTCAFANEDTAAKESISIPFKTSAAERRV